MPIFGHFLSSAPDADKRHTVRRKLSLLASGVRHDGTGIDVQIHNISGTGLLFESDVGLAAGDKIEIELPHAGDITAAVIWASGRLFGCQFEGPVSPATLSAVELKSAVDSAPDADEDHTPSATDKAFGARLQQLRTGAGLNQSEVAERMGVSAASVSGWEKGRARPGHDRMEELAAILGVETSGLLEGDPPDGPPGGLRELVERSREQIARAMGIGVDQVRIVVEL